MSQTRPKNRPTTTLVNRRSFLKAIGLLGLSSQVSLLTACTHKKFYNPDQDIILGGGQFKQNGELHHVLSVINLYQREHKLVELDFLPHDILIDPNDKSRLITFEKNGINATEIDLNSHTESTKIVAEDNRIFSGHGTFNKSGNVLYCAETDLISGRGSITVRDASNFKVIDEISSFGKNPHQCQLINDGKTLVVANAEINSKSHASVSYIDVENKNILERVTLTDATIDANHFATTEDGTLIVSSAPKEDYKPGGVSIRSDQQPLLTMTEPEAIINKLVGEALSINIDEQHNIAAVTHPAANLVTFWNIDKKLLIKAMSVPNPRGITLSLDNNHHILSYGINTSSILINTKDLSADTESIMQPIYASGEHIVNWSKTLSEIMPTKIYS
jgi:uncharacterized protein